LLQNPDIVLVHYLNVPAIEDCGKPCGPILCSINTDKKEWAKWTKEELIGQLKPMFHGIKWTCSNGNSSTGFSVEQLVQQILDSHQTKPPPRTHNCLCTGNLGAGSSVHHKCNSAKHRIISPKVEPRAGGYSSAHSEHRGLVHQPGGGARHHAELAPPTSPTRAARPASSCRNPPSPRSSPPTSRARPRRATFWSRTPTTLAPPSWACRWLRPSPRAVAAATTGTSTTTTATRASTRPPTATGAPPQVVSAAVAQGALGMLQAAGRLFMVTDYSPEWSYPEDLIRSPICNIYKTQLCKKMTHKTITGSCFGVKRFCADGRGGRVCVAPRCQSAGGVKVLITGPWQEASSNYSCLFDQISVPASLIQPGVLRCYCPAHDTGLVTLQVAVNNQIISNSVVFEYKARALPSLPSSQHDWLSLDDNQFRMSILERLEQMERRMAEMSSHHQQGAGGAAGGGGGGGGGGNGGNTSQTQCVSGQGQAGSSFESRVVVVCEKMMSRACWAKSKHLIHSKTFRGMTLLHLAAAQGYATLIQTLIKWRTKHADSIDLELEVDPLNVDHFSCTPLMWACALGHTEAAVVLYKWDRRALAIPDSLGRLPLSIARSRGHTKLAECLEQLQREEQQQQQPPPTLPPTPHIWMVAWSDTVATPGGQKAGGAVSTTTNPNPDLRRPRSEPSSYYSSECQRDLPLAKKHKPNPELFQGRPDKAMSVPLSLEQQQLHKLAGSPHPEKGLEEGGGGLSQHKLGSFRGLGGGGGGAGPKWSSRELKGSGGGSNLGKEKLASRLRQREPLSMLMMSEREMVDTELLSYREDLENQDCLTHMDDLQVNMMTLAEHIIEATPERIKRENFVAVETTPLDSAGVSNTMSWLASYLGDVEHLPSLIHLRSLYSEPLTPSSNPSLSPAGSPLREGPFDKPGLPSPADWTDFLSASNSKVERDLAQLTLSDPEQRELYEAARLVQTAFRKYKGRPLREQQEVAAAVIQRCYRKYKQLTWIALKYALYKKMTQAAILIQSKFRSYHEQKKFQQSRRAAVLIQQYYRSYKEFGRLRPHRRATAAALVQHRLRYSTHTVRHTHTHSTTHTQYDTHTHSTTHTQYSAHAQYGTHTQYDTHTVQHTHTVRHRLRCSVCAKL
ncbi:CMTA1 protein, partial [Amia calva]|nr:CMTA1 protein [Amia calva]